MVRRKINLVVCAGFLGGIISFCYSQENSIPPTDSLNNQPAVYDPFGPENSPDHNGQGSGGVLTPSPYESVIQTYYSRISADYNGIQFMLDSPWQFSPGISWSSYQNDLFGILFKIRSSGVQKLHYDPVVEDTIPYYRLPFEASFDYALNNDNFRAFKIYLHWKSYSRSLGMAGIGVLVSNWNLMAARDLSMNRKWDIETTWTQIAGGYIMPLSPKVGGVNIAICGAVDLLGAKYVAYNSLRQKFYGAKIGSVGWLAGLGWNAVSFLNLSIYVGGEWSFATGCLELPTSTIIRADVGRNTLFSGLQLTGQYMNLIAGIQKEWEYLDFQKTVESEKSLRYYLGANYYLRR